MLSFEVLFAANAILALIAVVRSRAATFIILANVCSMLRALANIEAYGQPRSVRYLPSALFGPSRLETASGIFVIVTLIGIVAVLLPDARQKDAGVGDRPALPALPSWVIGLLVIYFGAYALSSKTLFSGSYSDEARGLFEVPQGGLLTCLQALAVYEVYRRVSAHQLTRGRGFGYLIAFFTITEYSKGVTGGATGFIFMAAFLFYGHGPRLWTRALNLGAILLATAIFTVFVRTARATLYSEGIGVFDTFAKVVIGKEERRAEDAEGLEAHANGAQNAAHVLACIYLYDSGYSREWRSLYDPIVYTFQPSFVMEYLGRKRAIEPAWELGLYFIHGGGIAIFGEMYWNGGYPCVWFTSILAFLLAYLGDTRRRRSFGWLFFYCTYTSCLVYGVGYGLTYLFRATANALLVNGLYKLFARMGARRLAITSGGIARSATVPLHPLAPFVGKSSRVE
jgi:hypothetical protein